MANMFKTHRPKIKTKRNQVDRNTQNYDRKWNLFSTKFRFNNPWCVRCLKEGILNDQNTQTDHIIPIEQAPDRKYDETNLQTLCRSCHSKKTYDEKLGIEARNQQVIRNIEKLKKLRKARMSFKDNDLNKKI
ncbi:HNH endonuclease signature motif containing protein [Gluconacetobacter diazotrophicus]|uniref:HNH endonuclease signature motif containing protein n=1 Tax=Gluconacetobacter diazotrophicus TaxID=33996 RepID=UPI000173B395